MNEKQNYLTEAKKLIQELENPLVEVEDALNKLNELGISDEQKEQILERLKNLGEVFEPRKNKLKTLNG